MATIQIYLKHQLINSEKKVEGWEWSDKLKCQLKKIEPMLQKSYLHLRQNSIIYINLSITITNKFQFQFIQSLDFKF